jgi:hypothetical protein
MMNCKIYIYIYCFTNLNQLYLDYNLFWMIWVLLSILKLWWCFEVWIWYVILNVSISWRFKLCKLSKKWYVGLFMFYKESMCLRHDSWNEMYIVFKAWGISIWTLNVHRSEVHSQREIIHGLDSHEVPTWVRFPWGTSTYLGWIPLKYSRGAYLG